jgi:D-alanyl-lipoteichoic acid acyltransferase DltB (MBOAT superfamily)
LIVLTKVATGSWVVSLSFYAFQALTYTIDVYRGDAKPVSGVLQYMASVSFFPTTLAGPITRVASLAPQWDRIRAPLTDADGGRALYLIGMGAAKKFLIADYLAVNLVERVFGTPKLYSGFEVLAAVYGYAFQLYYDFSGYTDIAIGSAMLLGIKLPANFNRPYGALNIADFWRRWHITLSNWLRDYLYFALPGHRTRIGPYGNLVVTMLLGGLWHGFSATFLVWGGLHGAGLAVTRAWQSWRGKRESGRLGHFAAATATFHFVAFCWIFFRASSLENAWDVVSRLGSLTFAADNVSAGFALVLMIGAVLQYLPRHWNDAAREVFAESPSLAQALTLLLLAAGIQYTAGTGAAPFIYQKF